MIRLTCTGLLFFLSSLCLSQTSIGTSTRVGVTKIGVYADQSLSFNFSGHRFDGGLMFYGPDYVFERNILGMSLGYHYTFDRDGSGFYFAPGLSSAFFHENKSTVELYASQLFGTFRTGFSLGERWSLFQQIGAGAVFNKHTNFNLGTTSTTTYFSYEVALGVTYYWRIPAGS